jgi:8-oxo-dGTP diphosphatase
MRSNVSVVLRNTVGKLLLQFRDGQAPRYPLTWSFFGGGVEEGENPLDAAIREIKQELAVAVRGEDFSRRCEFTCDDRQAYFFEYLPPLTWGRFILNEGAGLGFFTLPEISQLILTPIARKFCTEFL